MIVFVISSRDGVQFASYAHSYIHRKSRLGQRGEERKGKERKGKKGKETKDRLSTIHSSFKNIEKLRKAVMTRAWSAR